MREIKFRAFDTKHKRMTDLFGMESADGLNGRVHASKGVVLMQYTGLKDKNGKEIYEGDVLEFKETDGQSPKWVVIEYDERIAGFWANPKFQSKKSSHHKRVDWIEWDTSKDKVIGNIWENPTLLGK